MMLNRLFSRSALGIALCVASLAMVTAPVEVSAAEGQGAGRIVKKVRKGRLPNYYADVVTEKQREDILKIQEDYKPKIDALQEQLDALKKEMKEKTNAVLTADQKKKVEEAETAAKAKRAQKPAEEAKSADAAKTTDTPKPAEKAQK
jgi:hypothetical protein